MVNDHEHLHRPGIVRGRAIDVCNAHLAPSSPRFEATWAALVERLRVRRELLPKLLQSARTGYHTHARSAGNASNRTWLAELAATALARHGGGAFASRSARRAWPCAREDAEAAPSAAPTHGEAKREARRAVGGGGATHTPGQPSDIYV